MRVKYVSWQRVQLVVLDTAGRLHTWGVPQSFPSVLPFPEEKGANRPPGEKDDAAKGSPSLK
jgi:hypothetical protein